MISTYQANVCNSQCRPPYIYAKLHSFYIYVQMFHDMTYIFAFQEIIEHDQNNHSS